jgi:hypothetical protein
MEAGYLDQPFIWYAPQEVFFGASPVSALRGNCSVPNVCTCLCNVQYNRVLCDSPNKGDSGCLMFCGDQTAEKRAKFCEGAFQDDMWTTRNLLESNEIYGTRACKSGYEGVIDEFDRFMSCHLIIKEPAEGIAGLYEAHLIAVMVIGGIAFGCGVVLYFYLRQKIKAMALKAKIDRRKSRRSSEESITK